MEGNPTVPRITDQGSTGPSVAGFQYAATPQSDELVSVIVPTKNSARFLATCLQSIKDQTYRPIELVVVDNHSTDETLSIARTFTPRVFTWGPERSAQVNYGVRKSTGIYVYKVDSDFRLDSQVIESCVAEAHKGYDAIVVHNTPDERVGWIARIRKFEVDMYKFDITHSSARFLTRTAYDAIGGFNEHITAGEDYDFQNRLTAAGYTTGFVIPEALHLGEPASFAKHMAAYYRYGLDFVAYIRQNRHASGRQLSPVRNVYLKNWRRFVRHPLRGLAFVVYSTCKFTFGGAGLLKARFATRRNGRGEI